MQLIFDGPGGSGSGQQNRDKRQLDDELQKLLIVTDEYQDFLRREDQKQDALHKDIDKGQVLHWVVTIIGRDLSILAEERWEENLHKVDQDLQLLRGLHALRSFREHQLQWNEEEIQKIEMRFKAIQDEAPHHNHKPEL